MPRYSRRWVRLWGLPQRIARGWSPCSSGSPPDPANTAPRARMPAQPPPLQLSATESRASSLFTTDAVASHASYVVRCMIISARLPAGVAESYGLVLWTNDSDLACIEVVDGITQAHPVVADFERIMVDGGHDDASTRRRKKKSSRVKDAVDGVDAERPQRHRHRHSQRSTRSNSSFKAVDASGQDVDAAWQEFTSPEGRVYYYNQITRESRWKLPKALRLPKSSPSTVTSTTETDKSNAQESSGRKREETTTAPPSDGGSKGSKNALVQRLQASLAGRLPMAMGGGPPPMIKIPRENDRADMGSVAVAAMEQAVVGPQMEEYEAETAGMTAAERLRFLRRKRQEAKEKVVEEDDFMKEFAMNMKKKEEERARRMTVEEREEEDRKKEEDKRRRREEQERKVKEQREQQEAEREAQKKAEEEAEAKKRVERQRAKEREEAEREKQRQEQEAAEATKKREEKEEKRKKKEAERRRQEEEEEKHQRHEEKEKQPVAPVSPQDPEEAEASEEHEALRELKEEQPVEPVEMDEEPSVVTQKTKKHKRRSKSHQVSVEATEDGGVEPPTEDLDSLAIDPPADVDETPVSKKERKHKRKSKISEQNDDQSEPVSPPSSQDASTSCQCAYCLHTTGMHHSMPPPHHSHPPPFGFGHPHAPPTHPMYGMPFYPPPPPPMMYPYPPIAPPPPFIPMYGAPPPMGYPPPPMMPMTMVPTPPSSGSYVGGGAIVVADNYAQYAPPVLSRCENCGGRGVGVAEKNGLCAHCNRLRLEFIVASAQIRRHCTRCSGWGLGLIQPNGMCGHCSRAVDGPQAPPASKPRQDETKTAQIEWDASSSASDEDTEEWDE